MSNELMIPNAADVPAYARNPELARKLNEDAGANISTGMPARIKLSAKTFALVDGNGDEKPVPLTSLFQGPDNLIYLPVILLKAKKPLTKQFFLAKYNPNEEAKAPDCWSNDGERPDASIKIPQSDICATCPQNAFGSGKDQNGQPTAGKACSDSKILALFVPNHGVHQLRIPPASLKNFGLFVKQLSAAGIPVGNIKILLGFDPQQTYPVLIFRFGGYVPEQILPKLVEMSESVEVTEIVMGMTTAAPSAPAITAPVETAKPAEKPVEKPVETEPKPQRPVTPPADDLGLGLNVGATAAATKPQELTPEMLPPETAQQGGAHVLTDAELAAQLGL